MTRASIIALTVTAFALSACGGRQQLKRPEGSRPVPAAYGADAPATAPQLMSPSAQAKPDRQVEPLLRSHERADNPFDLPPQ